MLLLILPKGWRFRLRRFNGMKLRLVSLYSQKTENFACGALKANILLAILRKRLKADTGVAYTVGPSVKYVISLHYS